MGTNRANEGVEVGNELPLGSFFSCFFFFPVSAHVLSSSTV